MPPTVQVFATGQPTGASLAALDAFDDSMRAQIISTGLWKVSVIQPEDGIISLLINMDATSYSGLVYSHPDFAAKAAEGLPTSEGTRAFVLIGPAGGHFDWVTADVPQRQLEQNRLIARFMLLVHKAVVSVREGTGEVVDEGAPLPVQISDSCEAKYKILYGESIDASMLGNVALLGKLSRALATRNLPTVNLANVFSQCEDKSMGEESLVMDGNGNLRKKQKVMRMGSQAAFLARLELFMSSLVFVSVLAPAPASAWSGDPDEGVVGGTRYQLSRHGAQRYLTFWRDTIMRRGAESVDSIIALEKDMRSKWGDPFRRHRSLQCCILDSIRDFQGVVFARLACQTRLQDLGSPRKPGGPKDPKDFSKLPGFDASQPTAKKMSDGTLVCKHHNVPSGCTYGEKCRFAHVCDVRMPNGSACGSKSHNRLGHKKAMQDAAAAAAPASED